MKILEPNNKNCVYCIMDMNRGLMYFGQTRNYDKRSKEHMNDLKGKRHYNIRLQRLFNNNAERSRVGTKYKTTTDVV